ncbi:hypothetical protein NIK97_18515 [Brucella pseudintermedia]|uniref:Uncharacterized protein n=1 Tax=Brucella pseudintermedia TaxID=370111 RepID=A0ABY5UEW2_9HYPH|nr:hypothetical protein [Brucella pseudintermedia]UWL61871.1 hypothetical protein NIK97_18515 [Brucella pseudintermedia]
MTRIAGSLSYIEQQIPFSVAVKPPAADVAWIRLHHPANKIGNEDVKMNDETEILALLKRWDIQQEGYMLIATEN